MELVLALEVTQDLRAQICPLQDVWITQHAPHAPQFQAALGVSLHWEPPFAQKLLSALHQHHVDRLL